MKTFYIKTLGCKVNSYESEFIRNSLLNEGYKEVSENADVCIINSCTVTNTADNKSFLIYLVLRKVISDLGLEYKKSGLRLTIRNPQTKRSLI